MHFKIKGGVGRTNRIGSGEEFELGDVGEGDFIIIGNRTFIGISVPIRIDPESTEASRLKLQLDQAIAIIIGKGKVGNGKGEDGIFTGGHGVIGRSRGIIDGSDVDGHEVLRGTVISSIMDLELKGGVACTIGVSICQEFDLGDVGEVDLFVVYHFGLSPIEGVVAVGIEPELSLRGSLEANLGQRIPFCICEGIVRNSKGEDRVFDGSDGVGCRGRWIIFGIHINGDGVVCSGVGRAIMNGEIEGRIARPNGIGIGNELEVRDIGQSDFIIVGDGSFIGQSIGICIDPESAGRDCLKTDFGKW